MGFLRRRARTGSWHKLKVEALDNNGNLLTTPDKKGKPKKVNVYARSDTDRAKAGVGGELNSSKTNAMDFAVKRAKLIAFVPALRSQYRLPHLSFSDAAQVASGHFGRLFYFQTPSSVGAMSRSEPPGSSRCGRLREQNKRHRIGGVVGVRAAGDGIDHGSALPWSAVMIQAPPRGRSA